jgi:hypothetical protein
MFNDAEEQNLGELFEKVIILLLSIVCKGGAKVWVVLNRRK